MKQLISIKKILLALSIIFTFSWVVAPVGYAQLSKDQVCEGVGAVQSGSGGCKSQGATGQSSVESTIKKVVDVLSFVVGVASVIMIIIGGLRYVLSNGDSGNITSAKNTIIYSLVGLVIVALAQIIVNFVIKETL